MATTTTAPDTYVVILNKRQGHGNFYLTYGYETWLEEPEFLDRMATNTPGAALEFRTHEEATMAVTLLNTYGRYGRVLRRAGATTLTDEGRAAMLARRAARNADRKW